MPGMEEWMSEIASDVAGMRVLLDVMLEILVSDGTVTKDEVAEMYNKKVKELYGDGEISTETVGQGGGGGAANTEGLELQGDHSRDGEEGSGCDQV